MSRSVGLRRIALGALALAALMGLGALPTAHGASTTQRSPRCVPGRLNASALLPGTPLTVAPLPGSYDASPWTQISLLGAPASAIEGVTVRGSRSGSHSGSLLPYSQGDGASFVLAKPLRPGEAVTVHGNLHTEAGVKPFSFSFTVAERDPIAHTPPGAKYKAKPNEEQVFHSVPGMIAPSVKVMTSSTPQAPGYIFAAPYSGPAQNGPMIFDGSGKLVWFKPLPYDVEATNLQVESYEGKPVLSWWQGYIPRQGFGEGEEIVVDSSYRKVMHVHAGNGYWVDLHDFHINAQNGTALLTVFNPIACDLSSAHGRSNAAVTDGVFEEVDLKTGLVRRQWHSIDHVSLAHSYSAASGGSMAWPFDYFHINGIETRKDGSFMISSRNTSAVYFIDPATEQVTLQIGGKNGNVKIGAGAATAYQHDAQELPNGLLSIFDNGGVPMVHSQSRAIVVSLDSTARTLKLVAQYVHNKPLKSGSQGNVQLLENGNFFVGWGQVPYVSEYTSSGKVVFDARLPHATETYRAYRFQWTATPAEPPAVAIGEQGESANTPVFASWNGATTVATWQVLAGPSPQELKPVASAARANFETKIEAPGEPAYIAVQALDSSGTVLGTSKTIQGLSGAGASAARLRR
ncbi:MAG: arylsulfotransferase family protein [Solirubrobacteraceae bacterium]